MLTEGGPMFWKVSHEGEQTAMKRPDLRLSIVEQVIDLTTRR